MNIEQRIREFQNNITSNEEQSSIFLNLADQIIRDFPYRLKNKTYLLIPGQEKQLTDMAYEYYLSKGKIIPISLPLLLSTIMNKFNEVVEKLGFTIITEMNDYHNDGQLFDLIGRGFNQKELQELDNINISNINKPLSFSVDDYLKRIFLPVVFKNVTTDRGEDKYLIENEEQLKKIIALFELPESKKINLKNEFIVQEYIKGLENINSSIRVYTTATGEILSSLFLVSTDQTSKQRIKKYGIDIFNPCEYLTDRNSPYFLNSKNIISNAAGGGKIISFNTEPNKLSATDEIMLTLHKINIETLELPKTIVRQCQEITKFWNYKKGIVLGIDFIYNSTDSNWYYLETNQNPSVEGYRRFMNINNYLIDDIKALMHLDSLTKIVENIATKDMIEKRNKTK